jgi:hypothetical protein
MEEVALQKAFKAMSLGWNVGGRLNKGAWKTIRLCKDCGMTEFEKGGCYPIEGMDCWRPKGTITVWDDEEI